MKTAVIAGVGPGLGSALARKFAEEGCQVALLARSPEFIQRLESELKRKKRKALAVPTDISDPGGVREAFTSIRKEFRSVDILVNHASSSNWKGILKIKPEEFEQAWRVTVFGVRDGDGIGETGWPRSARSIFRYPENLESVAD